MLFEHRTTPPIDPKRVVVLGAGGFVGGACVSQLRAQGIDTEALSRNEIDLLSPTAADRLTERLRKDDSLVVVSARAPCKDAAMLRDNIAMMEAICTALVRQPVGHVIYISSDAVYGDTPLPLNEASAAAPGSMHGVMHLAREIMLREAVTAPLAILRPTLIYGAADPHNGYGPNRFRRLAAAGEDIVLFGDGEERRDHVLIDDVAEIVWRVLRAGSAGTLNVATGSVTSFRDVAESVVSLFPKKVSIRTSPRSGPMPHGGYRPFDPSATATAFPGFVYTSLADGLKRTHTEALNCEHG